MKEGENHDNHNYCSDKQDNVKGQTVKGANHISPNISPSPFELRLQTLQEAEKLLNDIKEKLKRDIQKELENGIKRYKVLPLDWAMDRINPVIDDAFSQAGEI